MIGTVFNKLIAGNPLERFFSLAGLTLNLLFFINAFALLFPPSFLNPTWEVQTISGLGNYAPLLILGVALTGCGKFLKEQPEQFKSLRTFCYVMAGFYALCIPLFLFDSLRLFREGDDQISQQQSKTIEEIDRQQSRLDALIQSGSLPPNISPTQAKERLDSVRNETTKQSDQARTQSRLNYARTLASKLGILFVVAVALLIFGNLAKFLAQGITLDPDIV